MAWVLVLATRKGGTGKSSLAVNLAGAAVSDGLSVALVDLDSQASASRWALGREVVDRLTPEETAAAIAVAQSPVARCNRGASGSADEGSDGAVAPCNRGGGSPPGWIHSVHRVPGLVVIPTAPHCRLDGVAELRLRDLSVDVVIVDTPPDVGASVVRAALRQADAVLAPVVAESWGLESVPEILGAVRDARRDDLPVRFVVNLRQRRALHDSVEKVLRRELGSAVLKSVVLNAAQVAESAARGEPLSVFAPKSAPAKVIASVWREVSKLRRAAVAA